MQQVTVIRCLVINQTDSQKKWIWAVIPFG